MIVHNFSPVLIDFGILQVRWYSLAYIFGILIGWWYGKIILKKNITDNVYFKNFDDLIGYLIIGMTMGQVLSVFLFTIGIGLFFKKK